ncbi:MAG TPA: hypothetical protein VGJ05_01290 [Fimbriiglobus sp.]|jgi:hypothetical protein
MGPVELEYPYRGRRPVLVWACVAVLAAGCVAWAVFDRGPIRGGDGRVTVDAETASVVRWVIAGTAVLFTAWVGRWTWIDLKHPRRIALCANGVLIPRARWGWVPVEEFISYDEITDFRATAVHHVGARGAVTRFHIFAPRLRFSIARDNLPPGAFDEICRQLSTRQGAAKMGFPRKPTN